MSLPEIVPVPPPGLPNRGNSCYLNSVLQALGALPSVQQHLHSAAQAVSASKHRAPGVPASAAACSHLTFAHDEESAGSGLVRSTVSLAGALWQLLAGRPSGTEEEDHQSQQPGAHLKQLATCQLVRALAPLLTTLAPGSSSDAAAIDAAAIAAPPPSIVPLSMLLPAVAALRAHGASGSAALLVDGEQQDAVEALEALCSSLQEELSAWLVVRWRPGSGLRDVAAIPSAASVSRPAVAGAAAGLPDVPSTASMQDPAADTPQCLYAALDATATVPDAAAAIKSLHSAASTAGSIEGPSGHQSEPPALSSTSGAPPGPVPTHTTLSALTACASTMSAACSLLHIDAAEGSSAHGGSSAWSHCSDDGGASCTWSDIHDAAGFPSPGHTLMSAPSDTSSFSNRSSRTHLHQPCSQVPEPNPVGITFSAASQQPEGSSTSTKVGDAGEASQVDDDTGLNRHAQSTSPAISSARGGTHRPQPPLLHLTRCITEPAQMLHQLPLRGLLNTRNTCSRCGSSSLQPVTPFYSLPLQLPHTVRAGLGALAVTPPGLTLQACLAHFVQPSTLSEVTCTKCTIRRALLISSPTPFPLGSPPLTAIAAAALSSGASGPTAAARPTPSPASQASGLTTAMMGAVAGVTDSAAAPTPLPSSAQQMPPARQLAACMAQLPHGMPLPDFEEQDTRALLAGLGFPDAAARARVTQYVSAQQHMWVARWPQVLVLQLKRSTWDATTGQPLKVHGHVRFPLTLGPDDLSHLSFPPGAVHSRAAALQAGDDGDAASTGVTARYCPGSSGGRGAAAGLSTSSPGLDTDSTAPQAEAAGMSDTPGVRLQMGSDGNVVPSSCTPTYRLKAAIVHLGGSRSGHYLVYRQAGSTGVGAGSTSVRESAAAAAAAVAGGCTAEGAAEVAKTTTGVAEVHGHGALSVSQAMGPEEMQAGTPADMQGGNVHGQGGHGQGGQGQDGQDVWFEVSDTRVQQVPVAQVLAAEVSVLFYEAPCCT